MEKKTLFSKLSLSSQKPPAIQKYPYFFPPGFALLTISAETATFQPHYSAAFQKALLQRPDDLLMQLAFLPQITAKMIFVWFHDDTCRPWIGLQKHYSDSMMANQGLTRGCLGARHLAKSKLQNDSQNGGLQ